MLIAVRIVGTFGGGEVGEGGESPLGSENVLHLGLVVIYLISINTKYLVLILSSNP